MPNTLFHLAIQVPLFSRVLRAGDIHYVLMGAIVPDLPWILQRLVAGFELDPLDLRAYCIVQSSLFFCVVFSAGLALCFHYAIRGFALLSLGCLVHLLLDAIQTKFANGVLLVAPLDWHLLNFGWLLPEHWLFAVGSVLGLVVLFWQRRALLEAVPRITKSSRRFAAAVLCALVYLVLPWIWHDQAYRANHHFIQTLSDSAHMESSLVLEIDRGRFVPNPRPHIRAGTGQVFSVEGLPLSQPETVSTKGRLEVGGHYVVEHYMQHTKGWRDSLSIVGLLALLFIWSYGFGKRLVMRQPNH